MNMIEQVEVTLFGLNLNRPGISPERVERFEFLTDTDPSIKARDYQLKRAPRGDFYPFPILLPTIGGIGAGVAALALRVDHNIAMMATMLGSAAAGMLVETVKESLRKRRNERIESMTRVCRTGHVHRKADGILLSPVRYRP